MQNYAQLYFDALETLLGRREDQITRVSSACNDGLPPASALYFNDWPCAGVLTAFTVGLGLGLHVSSLDAHVELFVSMATTDVSWGAAAAFLGEQCRLHLELEPGATLDVREPLSSESSMSGFIVAQPTHWTIPPILRISDRRVALLEARPLYPAEILLARVGNRHQILHSLVARHMTRDVPLFRQAAPNGVSESRATIRDVAAPVADTRVIGQSKKGTY